MNCPNCHYTHSQVIDSRPTNNATEIRRRRTCEKCGNRFTTFERLELTPILVVKKNGNREQLDKDKILRGIVRSAEKRAISMKTMVTVTNKIFATIQNKYQDKKEIASNLIGNYVMSELKEMDEVAYIRFASVYRQFQDMSDFYNEVGEIIKTRQQQNSKNI